MIWTLQKTVGGDFGFWHKVAGSPEESQYENVEGSTSDDEGEACITVGPSHESLAQEVRDMLRARGDAVEDLLLFTKESVVHG